MSHHTPRPRRRSLLPSSRIIAIVCIALPLFLLGSIALLEVGKCHLEQSVREEMTFTVLLDPETTEQDSIRLMQQVSQAPYIKDVTYITPAEAARQLEEEIGEDPVAVLGFNPLQPSLEVHLKSQYAVADSMAQIESDFASWGNVQMMSYRGDMLQMIDENMQHLSTILLIVSLILLIIAIIQVNSMTHIMIYSRRFLIRSMTLLGAKPSLIRKPFTTYSIFNGLWGGLLAVCMILGTLGYMTQRNPLLIESYLSYSEVAIILGGIICLGILLSWITASISTSKYIRMDGGRIVMA
ncbi:permease-like cell division protein FtsX [uncultured Porphyromonas sp.]|mgnify:FL=1|uniref:cell division protein FtsX n=1 Tax=uncultured Porphyromonas sp. TaxID=159274 RepID=UPI0026359DD1|nr:permease-like cell division protein FtsX [uncultured Porphyromonas sp.]